MAKRDTQHMASSSIVRVGSIRVSTSVFRIFSVEKKGGEKRERKRKRKKREKEREKLES